MWRGMARYSAAFFLGALLRGAAALLVVTRLARAGFAEPAPFSSLPSSREPTCDFAEATSASSAALVTAWTRGAGDLSNLARSEYGSILTIASTPSDGRLILALERGLFLDLPDQVRDGLAVFLR